MFISHSYLFCSSAKWSPPATFNWQIDSAICKLDHLQKRPDWQLVKCHRVAKHKEDRSVALWPDVLDRAQSRWQTIHYMLGLWTVQNMKTTAVQRVIETVSHRTFLEATFISAELSSQCVSSTRIPEFHCLLTRVYSGQSGSGNVCCVCSGRAASGYQPYSSTHKRTHSAVPVTITWQELR